MIRRQLFCWSALFVLYSGTAQAEETLLESDFGKPRVIVPAPADPANAYLAWPKIVRTPDGALIAAYVAGRYHGEGGGGCPAVSYSTDGGKTFSSPDILKRYGPGQKYTSGGNVALGIAEDGAAVLLSMARDGDKANTIDGWRSTDSGRTWTPVDVSTLDDSKTGSVFGEILRVPGKGLAVFGHYRRPQRSGIWMAWSTDHGKTWGEPRRISEDSPYKLVEPAFIFSEGRFVGLIRTGQNSFMQMISDDLGETWKTKNKGLVSDWDGKLMMPSPCLVVDPEQPGRLYALASERHVDRSKLQGRIVLLTADVKELNWKVLGDAVRFLPRKPHSDFTYPWMTSLGGGKWYSVFYCNTPHKTSDIYGMTLKIPAADAE